MLVEKDMSNQLDRLRIFFCLLLHIHQLIQHLFIKTEKRSALCWSLVKATIVHTENSNWICEGRMQR